MAPKKNKTKLALGDFLSIGGDGPSNWADEMDSVVMPTAPGQFNPDALPPFKRPQGGDRMGDFASRDRGDMFRSEGDMRPSRAEVPFPTAPPYTAFIGNMSFESGSDDVKDFFSDSALLVTSVRMVTDFNGKSKGFCYAEFPEAEMLRTALGLTGTNLGGRQIRISVAEPPKGSDSKSAGDWTRTGPLPDLPGRGGGFGSRGGPPAAMGEAGVERNWGDVRGGKFTPSAPASPALGSGRPSMGMGGGFRDRDASAGSNVSGGDVDWSAMRGGRFTPSVPPTPSTSTERRSGFGMERKTSETDGPRDWRARASPASPALSDGSSGVSAPAAPAERKKLQLSARSATNGSSEGAASPAASSSSKSNIFGAAQPVDTAAREQALLDARIEKERAQAEEKRQKQESDAAAASAEKAKKANPFGAARPVDNSAREQEVEAKLQKEREDLNNATKAMKEAKIAEDKSANPKKEWRRPAGPNAGLTDSMAAAPQSAASKTQGSSSTSVTEDASKAPPTSPKQIAKNAGMRKEGFSYSSMAAKVAQQGGVNQNAGKPASQPLTTGEIIPDNTPVKAGSGTNAAAAAVAEQAGGAVDNAASGATKDSSINAEANTDGNDQSNHMSQRNLTGSSVTEA